MYLGRLSPWKGIHFLLEGWDRALRARRAGGEWHLVIAGWGQQGYEGQLRTQARELGIEATVSFPGPQFGQAKAAAFGNASAFVLPSIYEAQPTVVMEAWASGLPVLMTPQCNLQDGFAAAAALRVEARADDIARGLLELFSMTDAERREMGARGLRLVQERYTWSRVALAMKAVYDWVLGGGSPPPSVRLD
jgi:poly(glycerol-phosphate) alpha-glucosyltransferase